jgi:hypothetical protein
MVIYGEDGLPCVTSWSTGAFVVMKTGKPARLPAEICGAVTIDPKVDMEYQSKKIRPEANLPVAGTLPPVRVNRHMNNARYVQIALGKHRLIREKGENIR